MKTPRHPAEAAASARSRTFLRRLPIVLVALAFAVFAASALAGSNAATASYVISGSITNTDPVVTNPMYATSRSDNACTQFAGLAQLSGTFHYKLYRFQNMRGWWSGGAFTGQTSCANVSLQVYSGSAIAAGYLDVFNPSEPSDGLWASVGGLGPGQFGDFPLLALAGNSTHPFDVVVYETIANGGASYTLLVEGIGIIMTGGGPTATASLKSFRASSAPKGVRVSWRTSSERDALGFNVYRGDKKKVRLTRSIVRAAGDRRGHSYSYIDRSARKGKAAPYYLEVVQRGGSKIMFGPAVAAR